MALLTDRLQAWLAAVEARHLSDLTFSEVSRALRALSSAYVERRGRLREGAALAGAGKRAAFALYYGPLHLLLVHHIVSTLGPPYTAVRSVEDLGCGTGTSGAGWALACDRPPRLFGVDRHPWAVDEARRTWTDLGLHGTVAMGDITHDASSRSRQAGSDRSVARDATGVGLLLAYAVNEVHDPMRRAALLARLLAHADRGGHVLVIEPLAGFVAPWWREWQAAFDAAGGTSREWRVRTTMPPLVDKLARAAGLDARELKGRSLSM